MPCGTTFVDAQGEAPRILSAEMPSHSLSLTQTYGPDTGRVSLGGPFCRAAFCRVSSFPQLSVSARCGLISASSVYSSIIMHFFARVKGGTVFQLYLVVPLSHPYLLLSIQII